MVECVAGPRVGLLARRYHVDPPGSSGISLTSHCIMSNVWLCGVCSEFFQVKQHLRSSSGYLTRWYLLGGVGKMIDRRSGNSFLTKGSHISVAHRYVSVDLKTATNCPQRFSYLNALRCSRPWTRSEYGAYIILGLSRTFSGQP